MIFAAVFLVNACALFFLPATVALNGDLVPEAQQAEGARQWRLPGVRQPCDPRGSSYRPPHFLAFGPTWALVIDALSFVVVLLTLRVLRAPPSVRRVRRGARGHLPRELAGGVRFSLTNLVIVTLLIGLAIAKLEFGALNALDDFFMTQNLHALPNLSGPTAAAICAGALPGAALAERVGLERMMWLSLTGLGVAMAVWSHMTDFASALVAIGLAGYLARAVLAGVHAEVPGVSLLSFGPIDGIFAMSGLLAVLGGLYADLRLRGVQLTPLRAHSRRPTRWLRHP